MYDIGIPEIICKEKYTKEDNPDAIYYNAESPAGFFFCQNPNCNSKVRAHIHSRVRNLIKDIKQDGHIVYINLSIKRFRCPNCHQVFSEKFSFYDMQGHMTNRLKDEFVKRCSSGEVYNDIADEYKVNRGTVANVINEYFNKIDLSYDIPNLLGIYSISIKKQPRTILLDLKTSKILDIKEGVDKSILNTIIHNEGNLPQIVTNVNDYIEILKDDDDFKNNLIILPSHIEKMVLETVQQMIVKLENQFCNTEEDSKSYKYFKKIVPLNWEDLATSKMKHLTKWFKKAPLLHHLYIIKESVKDIYSLASNKEEAETLFDAWLEIFPQTEDILKLKNQLIKNKEHILHHWDIGYDTGIFVNISETAQHTQIAGRTCSFATIVKKIMLEINSLNSGVITEKQFAIPKQREKFLKLYNTVIDYNISIPVQFTNRLQEYMYLYFKSKKYQ